MKKLLVIAAATLMILAPGCKSKPETAEEKKNLVITQGGKFLKEINVTTWQPGNEVTHIGAFPIIWEGQDTMECRVQEGLLYVDDQLVGADLSVISVDKVPDPDNIVIVTKATPEAMPKLKRFKNLLVLEAYGMRDEDAAYLEDFPGLKGLYLIRSGIAFNGLEHISKLTNLNTLYLPGANITNPAMVHLEKLTNLRDLNVSSNHFDDQGLLSIKKLKSLRELNLNYSLITDEGLENLKELTGLRVLYLKYNGHGDMAIKMLQRALPNCIIYYL